MVLEIIIIFLFLEIRKLGELLWNNELYYNYEEISSLK